MGQSWLEIRGVKQNNLKNISLKIPHNKVIAITGVSGSGKSSLAFETIFAEGQWRFIESLTSYARLFMEKMDRPELDYVKNIRPAIALEQRNPVKGTRSTVGTITELYDYLRLLFYNIAERFCPTCGNEIKCWDSSSLFHYLINNHGDKKAMVIFESNETLKKLMESGFYRVYLNGEVLDIHDVDEAEVSPPHLVVLDRLVIRNETRLSDSLELAFFKGNGAVTLNIIGEGEKVFQNANLCSNCNSTQIESSAMLFSFNHPLGACKECKGFGNVLYYDRTLIVPNDSLSIKNGAIEPFEKPSLAWWKKHFIKNAHKGSIDIDKPLKDFTENEWQILFKGAKGFLGIDEFFNTLEDKRYKVHVRVFLSKYRISKTCPHCCGKRLNGGALSFRIENMDIGQLCHISIYELSAFFKNLVLSEYKKKLAAEILSNIYNKLEILIRVGLGYLTLNRQTATLSGGEYQRANLSNQLSARLAGTLYVLDEPTVGLHSKDNQIITEIIQDIARQGNTVLVVEHDIEIIRACHWVVELGPGGGQRGGNVVYNGELDDFKNAKTATSKYLGSENFIQTPVHLLSPVDTYKKLALRGAKGHNLKNINVHFPLNTFNVVTGVSGSGKSTLVVDTLYAAAYRHFNKYDQSVRPLTYDSIEGMENFKNVVIIDQNPIGRSPRSNAATFLKIFDQIRRIFANQREAKLYGYDLGYFSFNKPGGRCETCKGEGYIQLEMYFFEDLYVKCDDCQGRRYGENALRVRYSGLTISDILELTVEEALDVFKSDSFIKNKLALLKDVGLGYLRLGQSATTLSGGEAQRLKICAELGLLKKTNTLYILDEPTIGLHMDDIYSLLKVLLRLISQQNTIIVIEHNLEIIKEASWVIDIGPEGGDDGGKVIFQGTVDKLLKKHKTSHTASALRAFLQS